MKFFEPDPEELRLLRADPLLIEQELDVRPDVAKAIERACGRRSGRVYWRSGHDHLYAMELADLGRARPSAATVFGHWDRYEPRPPEHEIDADLVDFSLWVASVCESLDAAIVEKVLGFAGLDQRVAWPEGAVLRTPPERFLDLPGFEYAPQYVEIEGLRMARVEAGSGKPIVLLHGEPTWGYLYRKMIPALAESGRVLVPDLIGFGRSDKPTLPNGYSYRSHARWLRKFLDAVCPEESTLVCQDWGGLLGLRLAGLEPRRFRQIVAMNTGLPDGGFDFKAGAAFLRWRGFAQRARELDIPWLLRRSLIHSERLSEAEAAAYAAPFPDNRYQTGALVLPRLVPLRADAPGAYENRQALRGLHASKLPVLLLWGSRDTVTAPWMESLRRSLHRPDWQEIEGAGHFLQEDAGEELAARIAAWINR
jgi:haloalkane dehalogenase